MLENENSTYQQFSFLTLSKSEAFALARTSFRVSFMSHRIRFKSNTLIHVFAGKRDLIATR